MVFLKEGALKVGIWVRREEAEITLGVEHEFAAVEQLALAHLLELCPLEVSSDWNGGAWWVDA